MTRQIWIDRAKGVGICLVVFGHVMRGMTASGIVADDTPVKMLDYTLYSFHMPLFFLLSGLNAERSLAKGPRLFLADKLHYLVWPYFLWSFIQGAIQIRFAGDVNAPLTYNELLGVVWRPIGQFWFLYDLFGCHLILLASRGSKVLLGALAIAACALSASSSYFYGKFFFNFPFFVIGIGASAQLAAWTPTRSGGPRALLLATLCFLIAASIGYFAELRQNTPLAVPAALLGVGMTIVVAKLLCGAPGRMLEIIGNMSMTIFLLHILAAAGARIALLKLGVPIDPALFVLGATLVGLILPMLAHVVMKRLGLLPWLGISAPRGATRPNQPTTTSPPFAASA